MERKTVMGTAVTGTMPIIGTKVILQNRINGTTALPSTPQSSMQGKCAQSVMVDSNSRWIAEVIKMLQMPMKKLVQI